MDSIATTKLNNLEIKGEIRKVLDTSLAKGSEGLNEIDAYLQGLLNQGELSDCRNTLRYLDTIDSLEYEDHIRLRQIHSKFRNLLFMRAYGRKGFNM
jgi:hypothetical protein